ncbi:MAG TPA: ATP-binding protein [Clostridia bacterium]|nr:ATP-binding protein [Clostridia bacterium]
MTDAADTSRKNEPTMGPALAAGNALPNAVPSAPGWEDYAETQKKLVLFRKLIDQSSDSIFVVNPVDARILDVNETACVTLGYSRDELLGLTMMEIEAAYDDFSWPEQVEKVRSGELEILETGQRRKDGSVLPVEISLKHVEIESRQYIVAAARDITEKKQLEAKFLRAQRLESVGRLAGGIAHDLNNVLSPVLLAVQLLRQKVPDAESQEILNLMENSARRGSSMIRQVLTFARGIKGERIAVHFRELINELVKMGRETFPRSIQIKATTDPNLWPLIGDATQLHQVLMNLCVNACDAMPEGGVLELRAENTVVDEKLARGHPGARTGPHVVLTVRDTGVGIPPQILDQIFEPFFTTKSFGKGTGLGLATALGIVQAHGGFVTVDSQINKGSLFRIYLPSQGEEADAKQHTSPTPVAQGRDERILVVDDEKAVRTITQAVLTAHGYDVITANDGAEAVALFKERYQEIDGVITDMCMPYMDGAAAIQAMRQINPAVPILAVSGLMDTDRASAMAGDPKLVLLTKPYSPDQLLSALARVMGRTKHTATPR